MRVIGIAEIFVIVEFGECVGDINEPDYESSRTVWSRQPEHAHSHNQ